MLISPRPPLTRSEKNLLVGVPLLLCLFGGGAMVWRRINATAEIRFPKPVSLPNPNGFDRYVAAYLAITPAKPAVDAINDRENLRDNPQLAAQRYSLARKQAWLNANAAGFALFRQATQLECHHPAYLGLTTNRSYIKLRQLARYKVIEAEAYRLSGNLDGAVNSALDIEQMGSDMTIGAPLIGKLVGTAILALGRNPLNHTDDPISKLNLAEARAATKRLEAILARRSSYAENLENERWNTLADFVSIRQEKNWRRQILTASKSTLLESMKGHFVTEGRIIAHINQHFDVLIADTNRAYNAPAYNVRKLADSDPISQFFTQHRSYRSQEAGEVVPMRLLLLRLALQTYRLETGAFPAELNRLFPNYLSVVPTDTYADNAPFHYARRGKTYMLYSVGPDGVDDKGTPLPWRNGQKGPLKGQLPPLTSSGKGDYVAGANG